MKPITRKLGGWLALVWGAALLAGCASHELRLAPAQSPPKLQAGQSLYIALATDAAYGEYHYPGSGLMLSQAIAAPLRRRLARVDLASQPESVNEALVTARQGGYELICYPEILHWEDRGSAEETSPDKVTVKLTLIEVASAKTLRFASIEGQSGLATPGAEHPQDLLPAPLEAFASSLF
jgi:hypothetical protein